MVIYLVRNLVNGKLYVGQTSMSFERRFRAHVRGTKKGRFVSLLTLAIRKYGADNFTREVIETCGSFEEANEAEVRWIAKLGTLAPRGYNVEAGGRNAALSEATKAKLRGRQASEATKAKLRAAALHRSPETLAKMSQAAKERVPSDTQLAALEQGRTARWAPESRAKNPCGGENNPNAKLTADQVLEIRRLYATGGFSQETLAKMFDTKQVTVSALLRRRTWAHL